MFSDQAFYFGPSSLTFSAKSVILELKGGENEIFSLCMVLKKVISFIYEKNYFGDRVPLIGCIMMPEMCLIFHIYP